MVYYALYKLKIEKQSHCIINVSFSEKALELNVGENLVNLCRFLNPRAYLMGYTLKNESIHGLDISLNIHNGILGPSFQFKKPRRRGTIFKFSINNNNNRDQHLRLFLLSHVFELIQNYSPIYYALPTIASNNELDILSPNFLRNTFFISPLWFPLSILDHNVHHVEIDTLHNTITVYSKSGKKILNYSKGFQILNDIVRGYNKSKNIKLLKKEFRDINYEKILSNLKVNDKPFLNDYVLDLFKKKWKLGLKGIIFPQE